MNYIEQQEALAKCHELLSQVANNLKNDDMINDLMIAIHRIENWMSKEDNGEFSFKG